MAQTPCTCSDECRTRSIWLKGTDRSITPFVPRRGKRLVGSPQPIRSASDPRVLAVVVRVRRGPLPGVSARVDVRLYVAIDLGGCLSRTSPCKSVSSMDDGHRQRFRNEVTSLTSHKLRVPSDRPEVVGLLAIQARNGVFPPFFGNWHAVRCYRRSEESLTSLHPSLWAPLFSSCEPGPLSRSLGINCCSCSALCRLPKWPRIPSIAP